MKLIVPLVLIISLMWFFSEAHAEVSQSPNDCSHGAACFYVNNDIVMPSGPLNEYAQYASLDARFTTGGERAFVFSPRYREWAAYDQDGYRVASGIANGGQDFCAELGAPCRTPAGVYRVYHKGSADCVSKQFPLGVGGAEMPYCMFFNAGYAIHGSPYISTRNGSHGCIRVHTSAAQWLSRYFMAAGTKVVVLPY